MSRRRNPKNFLSGKAFIARRLEMVESPAWRALSINARRVLDRLEVEHMRHGGAENGKLKCTRDDFQGFGVRRQSISEALAEVEALGFLEVTRRGFIGDRGVRDRLPSLYRLTYVIENRDFAPPPTDEWRRFNDEEAAAMAVSSAIVALQRGRARETASRALRAAEEARPRAAA